MLLYDDISMRCVYLCLMNLICKLSLIVTRYLLYCFAFSIQNKLVLLCGESVLNSSRQFVKLNKFIMFTSCDFTSVLVFCLASSEVLGFTHLLSTTCMLQ